MHFIFNFASIVFFIKVVHTPASWWEIGTFSVKVEMVWLAVGNMVVVGLVFQQQGNVENLNQRESRLLVAIRARGSSSANGQRCRKTKT